MAIPKKIEGAASPALTFAGIAGVLAVANADNGASGFGAGIGIALAAFLAGATIACGLACLKRGQAVLIAIGSVVVAGLAIDLIALAAWLSITDETYGKLTGITVVWSFLALVVLGLRIAIGAPGELAQPLYLVTAAITAAAGLISTWLIATAGAGELGTAGIGSVPFGLSGSSGLMRGLGASFVLLAALWFGTLAASRLSPLRAELTR